MESPPAILVDTPAKLASLNETLRSITDVAFDIEADGLYAYQPQICMLQLSFLDEGVTHVAIVDTLAVPVENLGWLFESPNITKIVHDASFDARMLVARGLEPRAFYDTSVAAQLLGHKVTGLAALVKAAIGRELSKALQHYDWRIRPLKSEHIEYLSEDVRHLFRLRTWLHSQVEEQQIEAEVLEEMQWRLFSARKPVAVKPAWIRIKGVRGMPIDEVSVLRELCRLREVLAEAEDVPPHRIANNQSLIAAAKKGARQQPLGKVGRMPRRAVEDALASMTTGPPPDDEMRLLDRPSVAAEIRTTRRNHERRVSKWRKLEALAREIDEQAVLPGHCASDLAALMGQEFATQADFVANLADIAGFGEFRVARYGSTLWQLRDSADAGDG